MRRAQSHILIVEDNVHLVLGLRINFEEEGYRVATAATLAEARVQLAAFQPDAVLLDLGLPDGDGRDLINEIFHQNPLCRVLVLSARADEIDRVTALRVGADDYITKPFSVLELLERVRIRLSDKRNRVMKLRLGNAIVDLETQTVTRNMKRVSLTRQESRVLAVLFRNTNMPVKRERLLSEAWGLPNSADTRTLDYCIAMLRRKIEDRPANPSHVLTVRGVGYQIVT